MSSIAYYSATISNFLKTSDDEILGKLARDHRFDLKVKQKDVWIKQFTILRRALQKIDTGTIFFEFGIPRMGKRADVVLVIGGIVFVVEFKVREKSSGRKVKKVSFSRDAIDQVHDYALDLKNFHEGSHNLPIVPILVVTEVLEEQEKSAEWAHDDVAKPILSRSEDIADIVRGILIERPETEIEAKQWSESGYKPTPTIIEAARALWQEHDVKEITRSDAGAHNLSLTAGCIGEIVKRSKSEQRRSICFITGVPGAGKTLAGLNLVSQYTNVEVDEYALLLSGNGPLVDVIRKALVLDQSTRKGIKKKDTDRKSSSFIKNVYHFKKEIIDQEEKFLKDNVPPLEKIVVFDESQRAWNRKQVSNAMARKNQDGIEMSEPELLIRVMSNHQDWCVIVCLVGGGQEITKGEVGVSEWLVALDDRTADWDIYISDQLKSPDYIWDNAAMKILSKAKAVQKKDLHLGVSIRSFRAEKLSAFIGHIVDNQPDKAKSIYAEISGRYPIFLTRDINEAREWLKRKARGSERYGLIASSGAHRLRPEGINLKARIGSTNWFLKNHEDVRSSYYLEDVATEFEVQGLELDWGGICWDADFRYGDGQWGFYRFRGTKWQNLGDDYLRLYLKNSYRVILTRARQGMVIFVPQGDSSDPTRLPEYYDRTSSYLEACGVLSGI